MEEGIWIPREILLNYSPDAALIAGALYEAYMTQTGGKGGLITVSITELLVNLGFDTSKKQRDFLVHHALPLIESKRRMTYEIDGDVLNVYFNRKIQREVSNYRKVPTSWLQTQYNAQKR